MDFMKFTGPVKTSLEQGVPVNGYTSAMWVERYREPGEFEIIAPLSSGLKEELPLGTIISHVNTLEAAIVENHYLKEEHDKDPVLTISGRTLDSYLEQRITGTHLAAAYATPYTEYSNASKSVAAQINDLINDHIYLEPPLYNDTANTLDGDIRSAILYPVTNSVQTLRIHKRDILHKTIIELLAIDDLGIKIKRRSPFGPTADDDVTLFFIHSGVDRSDEIIFSWQAGDLESAEYLWSIKKKKNAVVVTGTFIESVYFDSNYQDYDRRTLLVDGSDIDGSYDVTQLTGGTLTTVRANMATRGQEALANQKELSIASTKVSDVTRYTYRRDYNIGDIVSVDGNYGAIEKRRVIEYAEFEDENGESGYPIFDVLSQ